MSYRIQEHHPTPPHRTTADVTTPTDIIVTNGGITHVAYPVWC